jgi:ferredoxin
MLEALEDAGADMMFDCRRAECGFCEARILSLEGSIDHRDVFYCARQKNAPVGMTCCVSRVVSTKSGRPSDVPDGPTVVTIEVP